MQPEKFCSCIIAEFFNNFYYIQILLHYSCSTENYTCAFVKQRDTETET